MREEIQDVLAAPAYEQSGRADSIDWVLGRAPQVRRIAQHVERVADVQCTVLISGETGTGKELWANLVHRLGPRSNRPFVPVNCRLDRTGRVLLVSFDPPDNPEIRAAHGPSDELPIVVTVLKARK